MPLPSDGYSSGTGTTGGVCTPSSGDLAQISNNLLQRVADIERFLSRLVGADVYANNLAELAKDMGDLLNGSVMSPFSPNSPYGPGGSIPVPPNYTGGFSGNGYIATWNNGILTYEVTPQDGVTVGGGTGDYILLFTETKTSFTPIFAATRFKGEFGSGALEGNSTVRIPSNGLYHVSFTVDSAVPATTLVFYEFLVRDAADITIYQVINEYRNPDAVTRSYGCSLTQPFWMETGWSVIFRLSTTLVSIADCHGSIMKLSIT